MQGITAEQRKLSHEEAEERGAKLALQLSKQPFEETIYSFILGVHDWLEVCNLSQMENEDEEEAIRECFRFLGYETRVL